MNPVISEVRSRTSYDLKTSREDLAGLTRPYLLVTILDQPDAEADYAEMVMFQLQGWGTMFEIGEIVDELRFLDGLYVLESGGTRSLLYERTGRVIQEDPDVDRVFQLTDTYVVSFGVASHLRGGP